MTAKSPKKSLLQHFTQRVEVSFFNTISFTLAILQIWAFSSMTDQRKFHTNWCMSQYENARGKISKRKSFSICKILIKWQPILREEREKITDHLDAIIVILAVHVLCQARTRWWIWLWGAWKMREKQLLHTEPQSYAALSLG